MREDRVAREVAARSGEEVTFVHSGTSTVYRIGSHAVKVHPQETQRERLEAEVRLAALLYQGGVPTPEPVELEEVDGWPVTLWRWVEHHPGRVPEAPSLGEALRKYHDTTDQIREHLPLGENAEHGTFSVRAREARALHLHQRDELAERIEELEDVLRAADLGTGIIHGDLHPGNLLCTENGPVIVDHDRACTGDRSWDLAVLGAAERRGNAPRGYLEAVIQAYGETPDPEHLERAIQLRELSSIVWLAEQVERGRSDHRRELQLRLDTLDDPEVEWNEEGE